MHSFENWGIFSDIPQFGHVVCLDQLCVSGFRRGPAYHNSLKASTILQFQSYSCKNVYFTGKYEIILIISYNH